MNCPICGPAANGSSEPRLPIPEMSCPAVPPTWLPIVGARLLTRLPTQPCGVSCPTSCGVPAANGRSDARLPSPEMTCPGVPPTAPPTVGARLLTRLPTQPCGVSCPICCCGPAANGRRDARLPSPEMTCPGVPPTARPTVVARLLTALPTQPCGVSCPICCCGPAANGKKLSRLPGAGNVGGPRYPPNPSAIIPCGVTCPICGPAANGSSEPRPPIPEMSCPAVPPTWLPIVGARPLTRLPTQPCGVSCPICGPAANGSSEPRPPIPEMSCPAVPPTWLPIVGARLLTRLPTQPCGVSCPICGPAANGSSNTKPTIPKTNLICARET